MASTNGNYVMQFANPTPNNYLINPATLTVTPNAVSTTYSGVALNNGSYSDNTGNYSITGFVNNQTIGSAGVTLSGSMAFNGSTAASVLNQATYTQTQGTLAMASTNGNYVMQFANPTPNNYAITPATLTYVATAASGTTGFPLPSLTGTVTGFLGSDDLANATAGTLSWSTTAIPTSTPGSYPIDGAGLTAKSGNYIFVQAASNATALTMNTALITSDPGHFGPPPGNTPNSNVNITFPNPNFGANLIHVSLTSNTTSTTGKGDNDAINTASLGPGYAGDAFTHNNGFYYPPISQYDAGQYSDFTLPSYANDDSEAVIFAMLARAASSGHGADYLIDNFWNGSGGAWPSGNNPLDGKITFSNGDGQDVTPADGNAFPITGGTNFGQLLKTGPVMIGGPGGTWLLATSIAPGGKGMICDDPQTGGLVELSYNASTGAVGGITGVFDANTKSFVALSDAGSDIPANDASGLAGLQSFVPATYYAVTLH